MPEAYASHPDYGFERDFKAYGEKGLVGLKWSNNAKIAVSFVINYEEGGDGVSKTNLREHPGTARINERDYNGESEYEYGSRRLLKASQAI